MDGSGGRCLPSCIRQRWGELKAAFTNKTVAEQPPPSDGQSGPSLRLRPKGPPLGKRVIIIGGGIGGLTAARALLDIGCEVRPAAVGRRGNRNRPHPTTTAQCSHLFQTLMLSHVSHQHPSTDKPACTPPSLPSSFPGGGV